MLTRSNSSSTRSIVRLYYMYYKYISPIIESIDCPRRPKYRLNGQTKRVRFQFVLYIFFYKLMPNLVNYPCFRMVGNLHWSSTPGKIPSTTPPSLNDKNFYSKNCRILIFFIHCSGIFWREINIDNTSENIKCSNL